MEILFQTSRATAIETGLVAAIGFVREQDALASTRELHASGRELFEALNTATRGWIEDVFLRGEFTGKACETALLHRPAGMAAKALLLVGGGRRANWNTAELRKAAGVVLRTAKSKGFRDVCLLTEGEEVNAAMVSAIAEGALLGDFEPDAHKTDPKKNEKVVDRFYIQVPPRHTLDNALVRGTVLGEAQNLARTLINEPANLLTPQKLAQAASDMAARNGLECEILDRARMQQLGMGALLGVAQGSLEPPAMAVIKYSPAVSPLSSSAHLALIGKGVTFDTGGISIKPSEGMEKMKYDMAGAAAVIGAMQAIARLKPSIAVTGYAPMVENMASDRAQRPGDIVTSMNGKTVEVLNTDAEGRLILIDAITYAIRNGATHLVDAATLTGSIAVALASVHAGLFTNDAEFQKRFQTAAAAEGERFWPMPMDEEYKEMLKSAFADLPNISGGRYGGSITAAKFLEEFVEGKPWIHLDIAGTAWLDDAKPFLSKGPTGIAVRSMVRLAEDWL